MIMVRPDGEEMGNGEGKRVWGTTGRGTWQLGACHEMSMCETGVTNSKVGQDHLSVCGELHPSTKGLIRASLSVGGRIHVCIYIIKLLYVRGF